MTGEKKYVDEIYSGSPPGLLARLGNALREGAANVGRGGAEMIRGGAEGLASALTGLLQDRSEIKPFYAERLIELVSFLTSGNLDEWTVKDFLASWYQGFMRGIPIEERIAGIAVLECLNRFSAPLADAVVLELTLNQLPENYEQFSLRNMLAQYSDVLDHIYQQVARDVDPRILDDNTTFGAFLMEAGYRWIEIEKYISNEKVKRYVTEFFLGGGRTARRY
jgi:hypothetical protein